MTQPWVQSMDGSEYTVTLDADGFRPVPPDEDPHAKGGYIVFQHGPIKEVGTNGTTVEVVISALVNRLKGFNENPAFRCRENSLAITHLEEALHWLEARTKARQEQGVEGQNVPHV